MYVNIYIYCAYSLSKHTRVHRWMKEKKYTLARTYYNLSRQVCVGCQQI